MQVVYILHESSVLRDNLNKMLIFFLSESLCQSLENTAIQCPYILNRRSSLSNRLKYRSATACKLKAILQLHPRM